MRQQVRRDVQLVALAIVIAICCWFGCSRPFVDKASPSEVRCIEIREELRVLTKALMGHMAIIDSSKLPSLDSKSPPQWLIRLANGNLAFGGLNTSDLPILRKALNGPNRFRVPAEVVGRDYAKEIEPTSPILESDNVPANCSEDAIGLQGFLRRKSIEVP